MKKNVICIISGPTACGKTASSIAMAKEFGGEIVNFDSLLFYKELNIGTAKPSAHERSGIPHHMIDCETVSSPINSADYIKRTLPIINDLHQREKIVYLVGGSGFYLQALLYGMYDSSTTPEEIITKSNTLYKEEGIAPFLKILEENDPKSFERYHENDHYRIRRAVEHFWANGSSFYESREQMMDKKNNGPMNSLGWNVFHAYLDIPRPEHWNIILERTKNMIDAGLINEIQGLLQMGLSGQERPMQSIGYKEGQDFIKGAFNSTDELIERISISTRQLAKSQRTWFKKWDKNVYNPLQSLESLKKDFASFLES